MDFFSYFFSRGFWRNKNIFLYRIAFSIRFSMSKRRRTGATTFVVPRRSSTRSIDKNLIGLVHTDVGTTQRVTILKTTTFPCTVTGLRWSFVFDAVSTAADTTGIWIIVVVKDGETINTIGISNGGDVYTPEQNVMAFGAIGGKDADLGAGPGLIMVEGSTKTMRKLHGGDVLQFAVLMTTGASAILTGCVQLFCKVG